MIAEETKRPRSTAFLDALWAYCLERNEESCWLSLKPGIEHVNNHLFLNFREFSFLGQYFVLLCLKTCQTVFPVDDYNKNQVIIKGCLTAIVWAIQWLRPHSHFIGMLAKYEEIFIFRVGILHEMISHWGGVGFFRIVEIPCGIQAPVFLINIM